MGARAMTRNTFTLSQAVRTLPRLVLATPLGPIHLRHERQADGSIKSDIRAPDGVTVDLQDL